MLYRLVKHLLSPDDNTQGGSSDTFRTVSEMQTESAPGEMGAEGAESGTQSTAEGDEPAGSLNDFVSKRLGKELPPDDESQEVDELEKAKEAASRSESEHDKKSKLEQEEERKEKEDEKEKESQEEQEEKEGEEKSEEEQKEEQDKVKIPEEKLLAGKDPIPVDRFKEVITERNTARDQIKKMQVVVDDWRNLDSFCKANAITPDQFKNVVEMQALLNTDPAKALERLRPIVNELEGFVGNRLPEDLQKAVDEGEMSLKWAREVAKTRAQSRFGESKLKHDRQRIEGERQAELQSRIKTSVVSWETAKRESDPDYKPKANASDPDGKWEFVQKYIHASATETDANGAFVNPITDEQTMTALMERAYKAVSSSSFTRVKKPATPRNLRSDGSGNGERNGTSKRIEDQPDLQSAVRVGLRRFGHKF